MFPVMDQDHPTYVDTEAVARTFAVSVKTVIAWIRDGKLKAIQPSGPNGKYRIPVTEIQRLRDGSAA